MIWNQSSCLSVVIVGRPNVGKSTLFNRLVGHKRAIVHATPGVTRDWRVGKAHLGGVDFTVIDTPGLEQTSTNNLTARMMHHTQDSLTQADMAFFVIDAQQGVTSLDHSFADWIRHFDIPLILVANKAETRPAQASLIDAFALGLGEAVPISAEHGLGLADLTEALYALRPTVLDSVWGKEGETETQTTTEEPPITFALVGRPNVGKSTLFNRLLGQERSMTDDVAGTTRDAVMAYSHWRDHRLCLVDTAGLRRRCSITEAIEKLASAAAVHALGRAQIVVLITDATIGFDRQDLTIARMVLDQGRGLILAVNKIDAVEESSVVLRRVWERVKTSLPQARGLPILPVSALYQTGFAPLMDAVLGVYARWNRRITTAQVNRWLAEALERHPPPLVGMGKKRHRLKLRYMTQIKARPPTFVVWLNKRMSLPQNYQRYLSQSLRDTFDFGGIPIRILSTVDHK